MRIIEDITNFIFVENSPQPADIIFLPGGSSPEPAEKASALYHNGYAPLLLPSGGVSVKTGRFAGVTVRKEKYNQSYKTDYAFYSDVLIKNGVPKEAILCENQAGWTLENALFSRKVTDEHHLTIRKAILCCKSFHARRCLMLYQMAFPETEFIIIPAVSLGISRDNWYKTEYGTDRVLGELARCGNQFTSQIKEYMRLKDTSQPTKKHES